MTENIFSADFKNKYDELIDSQVEIDDYIKQCFVSN